jgi:hypothetical protein
LAYWTRIDEIDEIMMEDKPSGEMDEISEEDEEYS